MHELQELAVINTQTLQQSDHFTDLWSRITPQKSECGESLEVGKDQGSTGFAVAILNIPPSSIGRNAHQTMEVMS